MHMCNNTQILQNIDKNLWVHVLYHCRDITYYKEVRSMVMHTLKKVVAFCLTLIIVMAAVPVNTVHAASGTNKSAVCIVSV